MSDKLLVSRDDLFIDPLVLRKGSMVIRSLNNPKRQELLQFIHRQQETTVTNIYRSLNLEQSVVSQHLAILRKVGLVTARRESRMIRYCVNYSKLDEIQQIIRNLLT